MVLIRVDFPSPVCPEQLSEACHAQHFSPVLTNTNDIELETSLQQLALDLLRDTIETDVTARKDSICHRRCHVEQKPGN